MNLEILNEVEQLQRRSSRRHSESSAESHSQVSLFKLSEVFSMLYAHASPQVVPDLLAHLNPSTPAPGMESAAYEPRWPGLYAFSPTKPKTPVRPPPPESNIGVAIALPDNGIKLPGLHRIAEEFSLPAAATVDYLHHGCQRLFRRSVVPSPSI